MASSRPRSRANQEACGVHEDLVSMKSMTAKNLRKLELAGKLPTMEPKPLDALLNSHDCAALPKATDVTIGQIGNGASEFMKSGRSWESELLSTYTKSLHEHFFAKEDKEADMFLNPADIPKGEKVLRIVDFLATLVPTDDERTISDNGIFQLVILVSNIL